MRPPAPVVASTGGAVAATYAGDADRAADGDSALFDWQDDT